MATVRTVPSTDGAQAVAAPDVVSIAARRLRACPPASVNLPPAYSVVAGEPEREHLVVRARIPRGRDAVRASRAASRARPTAPTDSIAPPIASAVPWTPSARTAVPIVATDQAVAAPLAASRTATRSRPWPPTWLKAPPATTVEPSTASALTAPLADGLHADSAPVAPSTAAIRLRS
ncbi:MAG: hypothetical protein R3C15_14990 [Thermoleophilia bacterium]